ncbi:MAG: hypothetical protein H8E10_20040 [Desulfobacterales bacterium]|nr:hypothetical protein [Desulfobacterales bacterium]
MEREESQAIIRRWKFYAESLDSESGFYLDEENLFIGTDREADQESERRAEAWEEENGGWISRVVYESQGMVG